MNELVISIKNAYKKFGEQVVMMFHLKYIKEEYME